MISKLLTLKIDTNPTMVLHLSESYSLKNFGF